MAAPRKTETVPIDSIQPHPGNPNQGDVPAIIESIKTNGVYRPVYVHRDTRNILGGTHTWRAQKDLGETRIDVWWVDGDEEKARRVLLADNKIASLATYDDRLLAEMLSSLDDLVGTGFDPTDLTDLERTLAEIADEDGDDGRAPTTGELLALADVTVGEPGRKTAHGEVWTVGRHTLVIARVFDEWPLWAPLLTDGVLLCPYPEPYLTTTDKARTLPLLLVQPNAYLAGHLLDKHVATFPEDTVERR